MEEADLQKFLADNKLDPAAIMRGAKESQPGKSKMMAQLEARIFSYPMTAEDVQDAHVANMQSYYKHLLKGCFGICQNREDIPFMTV